MQFLFGTLVGTCVYMTATAFLLRANYRMGKINDEHDKQSEAHLPKQ